MFNTDYSALLTSLSKSIAELQKIVKTSKNSVEIITALAILPLITNLHSKLKNISTNEMSQVEQLLKQLQDLTTAMLEVPFDDSDKQNDLQAQYDEIYSKFTKIPAVNKIHDCFGKIWVLIKDTDMCYTSTPASYITSSLIAIAQKAAKIVHYRELALLIPELAISSIPNNAYKDELDLLSKSIISDDGKTLIQISHLLPYGVDTSDFNSGWSAEICKEDGTIHKLTPSEIMRLRAHSTEAKTLYDLLLQHKLLLTKDNLYSKLEDFRLKLIAGGFSNKGTSSSLGREIYTDIAEFCDYINNLPEHVRDDLFTLRDVKETKSDRTFKELVWDKITNPDFCAEHFIAPAIEKILNQNSSDPIFRKIDSERSHCQEVKNSWGKIITAYTAFCRSNPANSKVYGTYGQAFLLKKSLAPDSTKKYVKTLEPTVLAALLMPIVPLKKDWANYSEKSIQELLAPAKLLHPAFMNVISTLSLKQQIKLYSTAPTDLLHYLRLRDIRTMFWQQSPWYKFLWQKAFIECLLFWMEIKKATVQFFAMFTPYQLKKMLISIADFFMESVEYNNSYLLREQASDKIKSVWHDQSLNIFSKIQKVFLVYLDPNSYGNNTGISTSRDLQNCLNSENRLALMGAFKLLYLMLISIVMGYAMGGINEMLSTYGFILLYYKESRNTIEQNERIKQKLLVISCGLIIIINCFCLPSFIPSVFLAMFSYFSHSLSLLVLTENWLILSPYFANKMEKVHAEHPTLYGLFRKISWGLLVFNLFFSNTALYSTIFNSIFADIYCLIVIATYSFSLQSMLPFIVFGLLSLPLLIANTIPLEITCFVLFWLSALYDGKLFSSIDRFGVLVQSVFDKLTYVKDTTTTVMHKAISPVTRLYKSCSTNNAPSSRDQAHQNPLSISGIKRSVLVPV